MLLLVCAGPAGAWFGCRSGRVLAGKHWSIWGGAGVSRSHRRGGWGEQVQLGQGWHVWIPQRAGLTCLGPVGVALVRGLAPLAALLPAWLPPWCCCRDQLPRRCSYCVPGSHGTVKAAGPVALGCWAPAPPCCPSQGGPRGSSKIVALSNPNGLRLAKQRAAAVSRSPAAQELSHFCLFSPSFK